MNSTDTPWPQVVILAGGNPLSPDVFDRFIRPQDRIIAADAGYGMAAAAGRRVDVLIGDMDSIVPQWLDKATSDGSEILTFPAEKDQTDLELALEYAACRRGAKEIRIFGALGGRWDMSLGNLALLLHPFLKGIDVCIIESGTEIRLIRGPHRVTIVGKVGDGLSLIPFGSTVQGIRLTGLRYRLHDEDLPFGSTRGISNLFLQTHAVIEWRDGPLLMVHIRTEPPTTSFASSQAPPATF